MHLKPDGVGEFVNEYIRCLKAGQQLPTIDNEISYDTKNALFNKFKARSSEFTDPNDFSPGNFDAFFQSLRASDKKTIRPENPVGSDVSPDHTIPDFIDHASTSSEKLNHGPSESELLNSSVVPSENVVRSENNDGAANPTSKSIDASSLTAGSGSTVAHFTKGLAISAVTLAFAYAGYHIYQNPEIATQYFNALKDTFVGGSATASGLAQQTVTAAADNTVSDSIWSSLSGLTDYLTVTAEGITKTVSISSIYTTIRDYFSSSVNDNSAVTIRSIPQEISQVLDSLKNMSGVIPNGSIALTEQGGDLSAGMSEQLGSITSAFVSAQTDALSALSATSQSVTDYVIGVKNLVQAYVLQQDIKDVGLKTALGISVPLLLGSVYKYASSRQKQLDSSKDQDPNHDSVPLITGNTTVADTATMDWEQRIAATAPRDQTIDKKDTNFPNARNLALGAALIGFTALACTPQGWGYVSQARDLAGQSLGQILPAGGALLSGLCSAVNNNLPSYENISSVFSADNLQNMVSLIPGLDQVFNLDPKVVGIGVGASAAVTAAAVGLHSLSKRGQTTSEPNANRDDRRHDTSNHAVFTIDDEEPFEDIDVSDLNPDTFCYRLSGVTADNVRASLPVTCTRKKQGNEDYFGPNEESISQVNHAIESGFKVQQIHVSWKNQSESDIAGGAQYPASYYAGLESFLQALQTMPGKKIRVDGCEDEYFFRGVCDAVCIYTKARESSPDVMNRYVSNFRELISQFKHESNRMEQLTRIGKIKTYQASAQAQEADLGGDNPSDLDITKGLNTKGNEH